MNANAKPNAVVTASRKAVPLTPMKEDNIHKMEWDAATSWQLRDLCGNDGVYVAVTGSHWKVAACTP